MDKLQELTAEWQKLNDQMLVTGECKDTARYNELLKEIETLKAGGQPEREESEFETQLRELSKQLGFTPSAAPQVGAGRGWGANRRGPAFSTHPTSMVKNLQPFVGFGGDDWGQQYLRQQGVGRSPLEERAKALGVRLKQGGPSGLIPSGQWLPVALPAPPIITEGRPVQLFRSLLPHVQASGGLARYMVQTERSSNAAVVRFPEPKPESKYGLEWREEHVNVVAHVSEPMNRFDLLDAPALTQFLDSELRYGVETAIETLLIDGAPPVDIVGGEEDEEIPGLLGTSGIQVQAFDTDPLITIRRAIGKVEGLGLPATGIVMSDPTWTEIEVMRNDIGDFILDAGPGDRAGRRLWNVPVATTSGMEPGVAIVGDFAGSSALFIADGGAVGVQASEQTGTNFIANAVTFRAEMRASLGVLRPIGFVKCTLEES